MVFTIFRVFARVFYFSALVAALMLISWSNRSHAQGVGPDGKQLSSRAEERAPGPDEAIKKFATNLTEQARSGKIEPYVGKNEKIRKITELLARRGIRTMILIGESGAGKTALIEHVAGQLEGKVIYSLNLQALMGGSTYRGMLEERLEVLLQYFKAHPEAILFIDEMQAIAQEGKEDVRNALLDPISKGDVSAIMNVTENDFKEFVEPQTALVNRSEIERIDAPTEKDILNMLRARKKSFEDHHKIPVSDAALRKAAQLVMRFEGSESRNRKALAVVDGAMARESVSRRLGNYDRLFLDNEKQSLELELKSLQSDASRYGKDPNFMNRLEQARINLSAIEDRLKEESIKESLEKKQLELSQKIIEIRTLEGKGQLQAAAQIRYTIIPVLESQIRDLNSRPLPHTGDITERHIVKFYASERKINLSVVGSDQVDRLKNIEKAANETVLFQQHATRSVMERLRVRAANVEAPRPTILLWDGPNGVGKTRLANVIAELETGRAPILIDGNKYQGANSAWQLLGSAKGHIDTMSGGDLEPLRLNPNSVVLIDEGNLASTDFWNLLYQMGSEGVLRDMRGRTIDARNAIIIVAGNFTQNYATFKNIWTQQQIEQRFRMAPGSLSGLSQAEKDAKVLDRALQLHGLPPGMRDRLSGTVIFDAFDLPKTVVVARLQLALQAQHIFKEHGVTLTWSEKVAEAVAKAGFDIEFNVRPIDRARSNNISVLLADLQPNWKMGDKVHIDFETAADGKGGNLMAKVNEVPVSQVRPVIFKSIFDPAATASRAMGEIGRNDDPTDPKNQVKAARKKGGRR